MEYQEFVSSIFSSRELYIYSIQNKLVQQEGKLVSGKIYIRRVPLEPCFSICMYLEYSSSNDIPFFEVLIDEAKMKDHIEGVGYMVDLLHFVDIFKNTLLDQRNISIIDVEDTQQSTIKVYFRYILKNSVSRRGFFELSRVCKSVHSTVITLLKDMETFKTIHDEVQQSNLIESSDSRNNPTIVEEAAKRDDTVQPKNPSKTKRRRMNPEDPRSRRRASKRVKLLK